MCHIGYCPICKQNGLLLTKHHKWKKAVWRDKKKITKVIWICRDCHDDVEKEITRKENIILRQHEEIYIGTLNEFLRGNYEQD